MSPLNLAKSYCDCYNCDDTCLGLTLNDKLQPVRLQKANSPCLLALNKRCLHFEQAILPMEKRSEWCIDARRSARLADEFKEGAFQYRLKTGHLSERFRLCPQCKSSKIGPGRKLCDLCKTKNRLKTFTQSNQARQ